MYHRDPKTGLSERRNSYVLEMFTDSVDFDIKRESRREPIGTDWSKNWIARCKDLSHFEGREAMVQYIIKKRREAGLPDISELNEWKFPSNSQ